MSEYKLKPGKLGNGVIGAYKTIEKKFVDTFLEGYDFTGKTMIPFATSGGSGISMAEKSVQDHCPKGQWKKGKLLRGTGAGAWAREVMEG